MTTQELRAKLEAGVERFSFRKKDGSIRNALGTRNLILIPKDQMPKHLFDQTSAMVYWDLEAKGYRSVSAEAVTALW